MRSRRSKLLRRALVCRWLCSNLLNLDNHKFRRPFLSKTYDYIYDAMLNISLGCGCRVACDEISISGRGTLESALHEEVVHKCIPSHGYARPKCRTVGFEARPSEPA